MLVSQWTESRILGYSVGSGFVESRRPPAESCSSLRPDKGLCWPGMVALKESKLASIESEGRAIAIYHRVYPHEGFEESAQILFKLVQRAQLQYPGKRRLLYLDIDGHRNSEGGFDADMLEL